MRIHFFLTGMPSVGKTTLVQRVVQALPVRWHGFFSENIYNPQHKIGRRLISLNGWTFDILKHQRLHDPDFLSAFADFNARVWRQVQTGDYLVMDALGPWMFNSAGFLRQMEFFLAQGTLLAVIPRRGHSFIEQLHKRPDVVITEVKSNNRDSLLGEILCQMAIS